MIRRLAVVVVSLVVVVAGAPAPARAAGDPRVTLVHQPLNNCELGADAIPGSGTPSASFALVDATPRGTLAAAVLLRDGLPSATYQVFLIQSDGDLEGDPLDCAVQDATLTTDARGLGATVIVERRLPTARFAHVYLFTVAPVFDYFDTRLVPVA